MLAGFWGVQFGAVWFEVNHAAERDTKDLASPQEDGGRSCASSERATWMAQLVRWRTVFGGAYLSQTTRMSSGDPCVRGA